MSPPDARARDMDNALKTLNDALVKCGFLPSDAMTHMRELWVTVDDKRANHVRVSVMAAV
jgi:Holliday junction resolvase RusA-like endonuclease